ncbi:MAG: nickel pincer cofactor biosynthesis protein LarB [Candidatus Fermentibacteraceae bacterium]|nr:nickel pincer cofactor biosynthesis protein LarB [Candidatus Fermentibacteraceae bacterium]
MIRLNNQEIHELLELLREAGFPPEEALKMLNSQLTSQLGFARVDAGRGARAVLPEIILAPGKEFEEVRAVTDNLFSRIGLAIVSRVEAELGEYLQQAFPDGSYYRRGHIFTLGSDNAEYTESEGSVAVISAGTSDLHVAEESAVILETLNVDTYRFYDVGVAGIHRLGDVLPDLRKCSVCIVCAGMDAALPTVIGGLYKGPIVAVPVSTGYGTAFKGVTALLSMLNSCSPGISVMNIDNGVGAAAAALRILRGSY